MKKTVVIMVMLLAAMALFAVACGEDDTDSGSAPTSTPPTPTATPVAEQPTTAPSPTPTTPPAPSPAPGNGSGVTGIPAADQFVEIRESGDVQALRDLVTFGETPCLAETDYGMKCAEGQAAGTPVPAWPWWGCHGAFSNRGTPEQIAEFFATFEGEPVRVLRFAPAGSLDVFPEQATLAVVHHRAVDGMAWAAVLDDDGNFYGVVTGCPATAGELVALHFAGAETLYG